MLIQISNLPIKKYMFDVAIILTYSRYFVGHLQLYLTGARNIKVVSIEDIFTRNIFIKNISKSTYIDIRLFNINY